MKFDRRDPRNQAPWLAHLSGVRPPAASVRAMAAWEPVVALLRLAAQTEERLETAVRQRGHPSLSALDGIALVFVADRPYARSADLARHLGVSRQAATERCARLVRSGHLRRGPLARYDTELDLYIWLCILEVHMPDGRARVLRLTAEGLDAVEAVRAAGRAELDCWSEITSPRRVLTLRRTIASLVRPGGLRARAGGC